MNKPISTTLLLAILASTTGCNSQQKQQENHDAELRHRVEELQKKSNAYPVDGSQSNHYIP